METAEQIPFGHWMLDALSPEMSEAPFRFEHGGLEFDGVDVAPPEAVHLPVPEVGDETDSGDGAAPAGGADTPDDDTAEIDGLNGLSTVTMLEGARLAHQNHRHSPVGTQFAITAIDPEHRFETVITQELDTGIARVSAFPGDVEVRLTDRRHPLMTAFFPADRSNRSTLQFVASRERNGMPGGTDVVLDAQLSPSPNDPEGPPPSFDDGRSTVFFSSHSFGPLGLGSVQGGGVRLESRLTPHSIDNFLVSGPITTAGLLLAEEVEGNDDIRSYLSWPDSQTDTRFFLRQVSGPERLDQPLLADISERDEDLERDVGRRHSAVLLDWRQGDWFEDIEPFDRAPFDVSLDGANLATRRFSDLMALDFRFHNMRLLAGTGGTRIRMEPVVGAQRIENVGNVPDRPILTMEIPGRHVFKQSFTTQLITSSDLPQADLERLLAGGGDPPIRMLFEDLRHASLDERITLREAICQRIIASFEDDSARSTFTEFCAKFRAGVTQANRDASSGFRIPADQAVYIGPDHMDRDLWPIARDAVLATKVVGQNLVFGVNTTLGMLRSADVASAVENNPELVTARRAAYARPGDDADVDFPNNVALPEERGALADLAKEQSLDRFRREIDLNYRDFGEFYDGLSNRHNLPLGPFPGMSWVYSMQRRNDPGDQGQREAIGLAMAAYAGQVGAELNTTRLFPVVSRSRLGGRSRLCFFWDSRDEAPLETDFTLVSLLDRKNADLSVPLRARRVFRIDDNGIRRPVQDREAILEGQGIRGGAGRGAIERMAEVYGNAAAGIEPWETSLELLSRIEFSIPQDAALSQREDPPLEIFSDGEHERPERRPNWAVVLDPATRGGGLRAIASPDFNPAVFLQYVRQTRTGVGDAQLSPQQIEDHYKAPNRGPEAPWQRPRAGFDGEEVIWRSAEDEEEFQAALSAYHRHSLVATSVAGRPGLGEAVPIVDGPLYANAPDAPQPRSDERPGGMPIGSFPAPASHRLIDLFDESEELQAQGFKLSQSILEQQDFGFTEVSLQALGPSVSIDAPFQPKAAALDSAKRRLFASNPIQQFTYESTFGEDELTRVLEKGYLFPLGHKATRVTQTSTAVIRPEGFENGREYPATVEITRTWITVSEPIKSRWFGQAMEGRERPFTRAEIVSLRTPDLVSPDRPPTTDVEPAEMDSGRIYLGRNAKGVVFWPRLARDPSATFKFEVIFDEGPAAVEMPLIFVDFAAATDAPTMQNLAAHYNGIDFWTGNRIDPDSPRAISLKGARHRYAPELKEGDTTYETRHWVLGAEGRPETGDSEDTERNTENSGGYANGNRLSNKRTIVLGSRNTDFLYDALLSLSDQPPFYPFLQVAEIQADRIARQTGTRNGPILFASYDKSYLQPNCHTLAPGVEGIALPPETSSDIILGVYGPPPISVGTRGDRVGAIGRPDGEVTALARREGPLLFTPRAQIASGPKPSDLPGSQTDFIPTTYFDFFSATPFGSCNVLARPRNFNINAGGKGHNSLLPVLGLPDPGRVYKQAAQGGSVIGVLCDMLGAKDMKILGIIEVCDFIELLIAAAGGIGDNIPMVSEVLSAGQEFLGESADLVRSELIGGLLELTQEVERRFNNAVRSAGDAVPGLDLYPEVATALGQFRISLQNARATTGEIDLIAAVPAIVSSGKTFVKALEDVAEDPIAPIRDNLTEILTSATLGQGAFGSELEAFFDAIPFEDLDVDFEGALIRKVREQFIGNGTVPGWIVQSDWRTLASIGLGNISSTSPAAADQELVGALERFFHTAATEAVETAFAGDSPGTIATTFDKLIDNIFNDPDTWSDYGRHQALKFSDPENGPYGPLKAYYDRTAAPVKEILDQALAVAELLQDLKARVIALGSELDTWRPNLFLPAGTTDPCAGEPNFEAYVSCVFEVIQDHFGASIEPQLTQARSAVDGIKTALEAAEVSFREPLEAIRDLSHRGENLAASAEALVAAVNADVSDFTEEVHIAAAHLESISQRVQGLIVGLPHQQAYLSGLLDDLVKRLFGISVEDARQIVSTGKGAYDTLAEIQSASVETIVAQVGEFVNAIDRVYAIGGFSAWIGADTAMEATIQPIVAALKSAEAHAKLLQDELRLHRAIAIPGQDLPDDEDAVHLPTREDLAASFENARKDLSADLAGLEAQLSTFRFPDIRLTEVFPLKPSGLCLKALCDFIRSLDASMERLTTSASAETRTAVRKMLTWAGRKQLRLLSAIEAFTLGLYDLLELSATLPEFDLPDDPAELSLSELARLLRQLERDVLETLLARKSNAVHGAQALIATLQEELDDIASGRELDALFEEFEAALLDLAEDDEALAADIGGQVKDRNELKTDLLNCGIRAAEPVISIVLKTSEAALGAIDGVISDTKAEAFEALRAAVQGAKEAVDQMDAVAARVVGDIGLDSRAVFAPVRDRVVAVETSLTTLSGAIDTTLTRPITDFYRELATLPTPPTAGDFGDLQAFWETRLRSIPGTISRLLEGHIPRGAEPENQVRAAISDQMLELVKSLKALEGQFVDQVQQSVKGLLDDLTRGLWEAIGEDSIRPIAGVMRDAYGVLLAGRNRVIDAIDPADEPLLALFPGISDPRTLFLAIDRRGLGRTAIQTQKRALLQASGTNPQDKLWEEREIFQSLSQSSTPSEEAIEKLRRVFYLYSGRSYVAAPVQIIRTIEQSLAEVLRAVVSLDLDISDVRNLIEDQLASILPTKQTTRLDYDLTLDSIGGIFVPNGDRQFKIQSETTIDLLRPEDIKVVSRADMSEFEIRLFGDSFDVFTMIFSKASFTYELGKDPEFSITFVDYVIGKEAEFLKDLQTQMGQDSGGVYVEPVAGFPGITAGYRLALPAIGLGAVTFMNVGLTAGAVLPFDNREAFFSVGISTRRDPFIILVGLWGGGGHFTLYTNGRKLLGYDASFVFAGGGAISAGLLELEGRVSVGVFVRKLGDISEISGDFFAGGSGRIAMFGVSSSLTVRVGQDGDGNMVGSAVFRFSFSLGWAKVSFAITLFKKEGKGFSEAGSEQRQAFMGRHGAIQYADLGGRGVEEGDLSQLDSALVLEPGEGSILIKTARMDKDYGAWRNSFAPIDVDIFAGVRG